MKGELAASRNCLTVDCREKHLSQVVSIAKEVGYSRIFLVNMGEILQPFSNVIFLGCT